jgi:riboflavin synthase
MFSGIVESTGVILEKRMEGTNLILKLTCDFVQELHVDQSLSHNGVCLTIEKHFGDAYQITAVEETLNKTNLGELMPGAKVNLERSLKMDDRFDGHIVQGHVDTTALCKSIKEAEGSWYFTFTYTPGQQFLLVEKGSVSVNGVSLTAFNVDNKKGEFTVAIIPYTYNITDFHTYTPGTKVNIEFDVLGKYICTYLEQYKHLMK